MHFDIYMHPCNHLPFPSPRKFQPAAFQSTTPCCQRQSLSWVFSLCCLFWRQSQGESKRMDSKETTTLCLWLLLLKCGFILLCVSSFWFLWLSAVPLYGYKVIGLIVIFFSLLAAWNICIQDVLWTYIFVLRVKYQEWILGRLVGAC